MIPVSQAKLVYQYLKDLGIPGDSWGASYDAMPDTDKSNNAFVTCFETQGVLDGRIGKTGETVEHYGVTVMCRHPNGPTARSKAVEVLNALEAARNVLVTVETHTILLHSFSRTSSIARVGEDAKRRERYNVNGTVTATVSE